MQLPEFAPLLARRLVLRVVQEADLPDLLEVNGDDEVTRYLPYASWQGLDDARAWLARMQGIVASGTARQLVIEHVGERRVIGTALLFKYDPAPASVELGYVIGRRHWRQGYAREAMAALCGHAFGAMGLNRIEAHVDVLNAASGALLRSLGFAHEGRLRQCWVTRGRLCDADIHGCLATDWAAARHLEKPTP